MLLEMHLHTKGNSCCAQTEPKKIAEIYKKAGYDGIVCTNHFNESVFRRDLKGWTLEGKWRTFFLHYEELKRYCCEVGIKVLFGIELARKGREYDGKQHPYEEILIYGITPEELKKIGLRLIKLSMTELKKTADENGWLLIQAHPFRPGTETADTTLLHGAEAYNGHPGHESHNDDAEAFAIKHNLIKTAGSDFHFAGGEGSGILVKTLPSDEKELVHILKSGDYELKRQMGKMPR